MSAVPLLPISHSASLALSRTPPPPGRVRIGRFSPRSSFSFSARHFSPSPPPSPSPLEQQPTSLTGRLRALIKTYGWYALGVYFVLSVLDFGVAFAGVHVIGADKVSRWTVQAKGAVYSILYPDRDAPAHTGMDLPESHTMSKGGREGLIAMAVLAYTVHKTLFLPFRVGLTAAVTPKLVNWLTRRGWAGSAGTLRAANHMREKIRRGKDKVTE